MQELANAPLARPLDKTVLDNGVGALNGLLTMMNNPELELLSPSSAIPPETTAEVEALPPKPEPVLVQTPPTPTTPRRPVGRRLLLSGRLATGKDYVAAAAEATIFGFADPMYAVASYFFGVEVTANKNKDLPGMRAFLQYLGQWGRNQVDEKYPYTPARAVFVQMMRSLGTHGDIFPPEVDWKNFGLDKDLWIRACDTRIAQFSADQPDKRVAITNARFENELKYFRDLNWDHWHVMCSPETWAERLKAKKLTPTSKELNDISEQIAIHLDKDVHNKIKTNPVGNKLRVIWNDHRPAPSARLYTLQQFLQETAIAELQDLGDQV